MYLPTNCKQKKKKKKTFVRKKRKKEKKRNFFQIDNVVTDQGGRKLKPAWTMGTEGRGRTNSTCYLQLVK